MLEDNFQMKLLEQTNCFLLIAVALAAIWTSDSVCNGDEQNGDKQAVGHLEANVESSIQGLNDSSYRTRRESFLKLCDRTIPLEAWLETQSKSNDKHRSAVAIWLKRLRRSNGTFAERAEMLCDYEALRNLDESALERHSVLERYAADGQWERLLELVSLLEPPLRTALLRKDGQVQRMIGQAWKSENESIVPRLLELVLSPTERVHANRSWRSLGMPEEWNVSQNRELTSVQITELEADGQIEEAVALAEKSVLRNFVEPMLIRSNRWDKWLSMDLRRGVIVGPENIDHQQAGMRILLGRQEEASIQLDKILKGRETSMLSNGSAILALALGRSDEFDSFLDQLPATTSFSLMRMQGNVHEAFQQIGLTDLSLDSVGTWLNTNGYLKRQLSDEPDPSRKAKELPLADYADLFFQLGLIEQGALIDSYVIDGVKQREMEVGVSAWTPLLNQWLMTNERVKAIYHWKAYLVRNGGHRTKLLHLGMAYQPSEDNEQGPFATIYPEFPQSASLIFEHLLSVASNEDKGVQVQIDLDRRSHAIELAIDQMEDLHAGRWPSHWRGQSPLVDLRKAVHRQSLEAGSSTYLLIELAELFDSLGETQLAIETLNLCSNDSTANQAKAKYLIRLGQLDAASDILIDEFQNETSNVGLLVECTETLEKVGRFGEMDRSRIQGLSSILNDRTYGSTRSNLELPVNQLVQVVMEQRWNRDRTDISTNFSAVHCLNRQYGELAKKDLSQAKQAANYSRIEALIRMKFQWSDETKDIRPLLSLFGSAFQSLILEAIADGDRELADNLFRVAFRCKPHDIDMPIVIVPVAESVFGKELADQWFDLFYQPMLKHLDEFPDDTLIGNNTAWFAASCNRHLVKAQSLASKIALSSPDPTYLDTLAEVEYRLGNIARAIELSERCLQIEPKGKQHRDQLKRFRAGKP